MARPPLTTLRTTVLTILTLAALTGPLQADNANTGLLASFRKVCLLNAPALDTAAIQAAASQEAFGTGDMMSSAGIQWDPGRLCSLRARIGSGVATMVTEAEGDALVVETMNRLGGGEITLKKVGARSLHYRFKGPSGRFDISFSVKGAHQSFYLSKL